jgi:hypothetical protein
MYKKLVLAAVVRTAIDGILLELLLHLLFHLWHVVLVLSEVDRLPLSSVDHRKAVVSSIGWASKNDLACRRWRPGSSPGLPG